MGVTARGWTFRHADRATPAVANVSFDIAPGERVLLLGASGAGKSTLLHALAGVLHDDESDAAETGELLVGGMPARQARGRVGLMQQDPETQVVATRVGDDVAFGPENLAVPAEEIWPRVTSALSSVGLGDLSPDHPTSHLSGGQKQRLALAGILAMRPGLILLDEPTANLDPAGVVEVRDAVLRATAGSTLVIVEHRVSTWIEHVDRVIVVQPGGGVLFHGPASAIADSPLREDLAEAGVWVPGFVPTLTSRATPSPGEELLHARGLGVHRQAARRSWFSLHPQRLDPVVDDVDLILRRGETLALTGPNGAGKSTLALTLGGLLAALRGDVVAAPNLRRGQGPDPRRWSGPELVQRIGTVFQEPEHQFVTTTVRDELAFGPRQAGLADVDARIDELLERLRLQGLAEANPYTLSGGEKRRLSVATMLACDPDVLMLDEPTFGQDARTWRELAELLREKLSDGVAIVAVTHDRDFIEALGARELRVADGRLEELP